MIPSFQCEVNGDIRIAPKCQGYSDSETIMLKSMISGTGNELGKTLQRDFHVTELSA